VHGLEDRQKIGMHCDQSELGKAVDLGHGTGILCIVVERHCLFYFFFIFFITCSCFYFILYFVDYFLLSPL
jgi:hypothetical protein